MTENNAQVFTENQLTQETTSSVYETPEEDNSSSLTASNEFSNQISCDEADVSNESVTIEKNLFELEVFNVDKYVILL